MRISIKKVSLWALLLLTFAFNNNIWGQKNEPISVVVVDDVLGLRRGPLPPIIVEEFIKTLPIELIFKKSTKAIVYVTDIESGKIMIPNQTVKKSKKSNANIHELDISKLDKNKVYTIVVKYYNRKNSTPVEEATRNFIRNSKGKAVNVNQINSSH